MPESPLVSHSLGDFRLIGEVRHGGCAEVQRATGPNGEDVAVKIARDAFDHAARLRREIATLESIPTRDPGAASWSVVPIAKGNTLDGRPWVAMSWYPHSLRTWVEMSAPTLPMLVSALRQAATAVLRLQATGETPGTPRLHRDLKPDNFLVCADEHGVRVVLADFGGARADSLASAAQPSLHYTPRYGPPEQTLTRASLPDPSIDTHALAVTIYWCFTGREPDSKGSFIAYSRAGLRLLDLQSATRLREGEPDELTVLRRMPLGELVNLGELSALTDADESRLGATFEDELRRLRADPTIAAPLVAPLLHALRRALAPDPDRRDGDVRKLIAAFESMAAMLREAGLEAREAPALAPTGAPPKASAYEAGPATFTFAPRPGPISSPSAPLPPPPVPAMPRAPRAAQLPTTPPQLAPRDPAGIVLAIAILLVTVTIVVWALMHARP